MLSDLAYLSCRASCAFVGKRSKHLGDTGGYAKAIPDITAALERGKIEGLPLFLMGHSYVGAARNTSNCSDFLLSQKSGKTAKRDR